MHHEILIALAILFPAVCQAQSNCPWLNGATARGILGSSVTVTVTVDASGQHTICEFSGERGAVVHRLMVSVNVMTDSSKQFHVYLSQCPPKSEHLRAIGNEAVMCSGMTHENAYAEKVVGRVRNQAFVVSVSSTEEHDPSMLKEMRRKKANLVAEQVAGILF
ncbi:MAG: hypothetical protein WBR14_26525 [Candidatus Acidiferrum sp.]